MTIKEKNMIMYKIKLQPVTFDLTILLCNFVDSSNALYNTTTNPVEYIYLKGGNVFIGSSVHFPVTKKHPLSLSTQKGERLGTLILISPMLMLRGISGRFIFFTAETARAGAADKPPSDFSIRFCTST